MLFIIFIADDRSGGESNRIVKYADDASLLVTEKTDVQINYEFDNVVAWASESKVGIDVAKTKEIVFHRPRPKNLLLSTTLPESERGMSAKQLGICLQSDLGMGIHVDNIAKICKQRLCPVTQLNKHGLSHSLLNFVFEAVVISRIT